MSDSISSSALVPKSSETALIEAAPLSASAKGLEALANGDILADCPTLKYLDVQEYNWQNLSVDPTKRSMDPEEKPEGDSDNPSFTLFFTNPYGVNRAFVLRNAVLLYEPKPATVPKKRATYIDDRGKTAVQGKWWRPTDKFSIAFTVKEAGQIEALDTGFGHIASKLFDIRKDIFSSDQVNRKDGIKTVLDVKKKFSTALYKTKGEGAEQTYEVHAKISGWAPVIDSATIGTEKWQGRTFEVCHSVKYLAIEMMPSTSTVFVLRMRHPETGKLLRYLRSVPLRTDGTLDSKAPFQLDSRGRKMWRRVGPQDITRDSVCDCIVDPVGVNFGTSPSMKLNLLFVVFDRAAPKKFVNALAELEAKAALEDAKLKEAEDDALMDAFLSNMQKESNLDELSMPAKFVQPLALEDVSFATPGKRTREISEEAPAAPKKERATFSAVSLSEHEALEAAITAYSV